MKHLFLLLIAFFLISCSNSIAGYDTLPEQKEQLKARIDYTDKKIDK